MLALLGVVISIGFADSINPSTVGPALYLASYRDRGRSLAGFILGVIVVSATAGVVLLLGLGRVLATHRPTPHTEHLVEVTAGIALAAVAVVAWMQRARVSAHLAASEARARRASFLVGMGIMAVELPTALPYFAVIAAVAGSGRRFVTEVLLILLFNLMFVAPLLAILALRRLAGPRAVGWLERRRTTFERRAGIAVAAVLGVIATILLAIGSYGLAGG